MDGATCKASGPGGALYSYLLPAPISQPVLEEKLITVFHELYHISPRFNGDIRRFSGACYMHTGSQKGYDQQMAIFAREYLEMQIPEDLLGFLRLSFAELQAQCGHVVGLRIAIPRLIPLDKVA